MGTEPLTSIVYVSTGARRFSDAELDRILAVSRRNNAAVGITGMLLYADGNFIQAIEGVAEQLEALMARLAGDPRHHGIVVIARFPIATRRFVDWSMGYRRFDGARPEAIAAAFQDYEVRGGLPDGQAEEVRKSIAHVLLEQFRGNNMG